ncbi:hypothetical protein PG997_012207 [Apiospora hydei]|uniref:Uncharacterized protein n=1 Tax=Apiospora hydei TaxID=1337664 RepID=A0ABR1V2P6_9PEZI
MENLPNTPPKTSPAIPTPPHTRSSSKKTVALSRDTHSPSQSPSARRAKPPHLHKRRCVTTPLPSPSHGEEPSVRAAAQPPGLKAAMSDSIIVASEAGTSSALPSPSSRPSLNATSASAPTLASTKPIANEHVRRKLSCSSVASRPSSERTIHLSESPTSLDDNIKGVMQKPLTKKQRRQQAHGNNYIFEVNPAQSPEKTIWKIGFTTGPTDKRQKNIFNVCQHSRIRGKTTPAMVKDHREYFDVDPNLALEVIHRWRTFCMREPYDAKGRLQPFWEDRLRDMDRQQKLRADVIDMTERRKQWDRFVHATLLDAIRYDISTSMRKLQDRGIWRATAVIEFLMILFLLLPLPRMFTVPYCAMAVWVIAMINEVKPSATICALSWPPVDHRKKPSMPCPITAKEVLPVEKASQDVSISEDELLPNDLGYMFDLPLEDDVF